MVYSLLNDLFIYNTTKTRKLLKGKNRNIALLHQSSQYFKVGNTKELTNSIK